MVEKLVEKDDKFWKILDRVSGSKYKHNNKLNNLLKSLFKLLSMKIAQLDKVLTKIDKIPLIIDRKK